MSAFLEQQILRTIIYFDIFDYPLTTLEIWRNLSARARYGEVVSALTESKWLKERAEFRSGMWALILPLGGGVPPPSGERARRYRASKRKLDIARKFARAARYIPWVRAIYACNSLGFLHARPESDIDLFVAARRGRIWSTRFFTVLLAKLFFRRPRGEHAKDAICLSFFAAEGADMKRAALPGGDIYYEHWLKNLVPLWKCKQKKLSFAQRICAKLSFERPLRAIQLCLMPARLREMANKGTSVIFTDEFLKFHDHDRREYYRDEFKRRFAAVEG